MYPVQQLMDLKPYGLLYFRGDTRLNWLGSYHVYRAIVKHLGSLVKRRRGRNQDSSLRSPPAPRH